MTEVATSQGKILVTCPCGENFLTTQTRVDAGRGKRCSRACRYTYATRRSGLTYQKHKENPTSFKSGQQAWNAGMKGVHFSPGTEFRKGHHASPGTEFKPGQAAWNRDTVGVMPSGPDHHAWLGEDAAYVTLHKWVVRHRGNANHCEHCGNDIDHPDVSRFEWANVSHEYRRELTDWFSLCVKCHRAYDKGHEGAIARKWGK